MRRSYLLVFASLLVGGIAFSKVQAQPISYGSCTRQQFESYFEMHPEQEKRPLTQFFDNARKVADNSVKLLVAGQLDELYSSMTPQALSKDKFREYVANLEQRDGKVLDYKFLDQVLLFSGPSELDLQDGGLLVTHYSVRTTRREDHTYLSIWTRGVKSTPMRQAIEIDYYEPDHPGPFDDASRKAAAERGCSSIRGTLKMKW